MKADASRLKTATLAAFALPSIPLTGMGLPVVVNLPPYYAGTLGLDLAVTGAIFLAVRLLDVPLDLAFGHMVDRTRGRLGRFRPWIVAGGLLLTAGFGLAFFAEPGISPLRALLGLLLMYAGSSAALVAHTSWGSALAGDYDGRSRVFAWWQLGNMVGLLGLLAVAPAANALAPRLGWTPGPALGIHAMGWVLLALVPLTFAGLLLLVPERSHAGSAPHGFKEVAGALRSPWLRRLLVLDFVVSLPPGFGGALLLFFFESARGYPAAQAQGLLLFYFAAGLAGAPLWGWVARRTSKHRAVMLAAGSYAVCHAALVLAPPANFWTAALGMALAGLPAVAPPFLIRAMLADVTAAEAATSGRDHAGLNYAVLVAVQKIGYAVPVGVSYLVLAAVGFDAQLGTGNTAAAITGLEGLFLIPPTLAAAAAALMAARWRGPTGTHA